KEIERKTERKIKLFYTKTRVLQTRFIILHLLVDAASYFLLPLLDNFPYIFYSLEILLLPLPRL
ncbi:MAG: hypothetical protein E7E95_04475, partial [Prevotella bivia]|nr:hypothetical protein [Prevotella bivia]